MKLRKTMLWALALALALLAGCLASPAEPTTTAPTTEPPIEQLTLVVTEDTIGQLEQYPALKKLDLTGSTCYEAIQEYMRRHPKVEVTYTVSLGTATASNRETALVLDPGACDYDTLAQKLEYLPALETVSLPRTTFSAQEIVALQGLYPHITWDYSMIVLGQEMTAQTAELNLSVLEQDRVSEVASKLSLFPNIEKVELMDSAGKSRLSIEDVKTLQSNAPGTQFHYTFDLFGKTVSTTDDRIEFVNEPIGSGEAELRSALDILKDCAYLLLDGCGFDNEVLAKLRADYPNTEVVWRIHVRQQSWLTDTHTIRAVDLGDNSSFEPLKYCTKVKYIDLSKNPGLTDISFLANMPDLEIVILSGSYTDDLTPLANAGNLVFLELAHCGNITDVTPLADCGKLANINLSYTKVTDLSPLYELPLERLYAVMSDIQPSHWEKIQQLHPDCAIRFDGEQSYGTGWRYKKNGAYTEIYQWVREVFSLDQAEQQITNSAN